MLNIHFINVADGDSILVEEQTGERVFRLLVDTGRPEMKPSPGSLRCTAAEYLRQRDIRHIDALVVTHLHIDHFGGLRPLMDAVTFDQVWSGFFPEGPSALDREMLADMKTVRGLADCLERWAGDCARLRAAGCEMHTVTDTVTVALTERLQAEIVCPDPAAAACQRDAYSSLLAGQRVPEGLQYWSSKYRNPGSLRVRLRYAGRTVELAGDCYGAAWEDQAAPCDIFKVPHHADAKSLTGTLTAKLHPAWAVISCAAEYDPKKDRPSRNAAALLEEQGAHIRFTDCFAAPWHIPEHQRSVELTIKEDGTIKCPGRQI